jgi:hypothetical protein
MHVEAFGMKTTEQASKYSKEEWWVSIGLDGSTVFLKMRWSASVRVRQRHESCNGVGLQGGPAPP